MQKILILSRSHFCFPFVYFCFYFQYSRRWVIEDPVVIYVGECFAMFSPMGFMVSDLMFISLIHFEFIFCVWC